MSDFTRTTLITGLGLTALLLPGLAYGQNQVLQSDAGPDRQAFIGKQLAFDARSSIIPDGAIVQEVWWDFGDGVKTTGDQVNHAYQKPGRYSVRLRVTTDQGQNEDTALVEVFGQVAILMVDTSASDDNLAAAAAQAEEHELYLMILRAHSGGPEVVTEEDLTAQLVDAREAVTRATTIISWTSGGVGANALSKFAQHIRSAKDLNLADLAMGSKGIIMLSDTPLGVLAPTAQTTSDQLRPGYVLLTRPNALATLFTKQSAEEIKLAILTSSFEHRLLGTFSSRTVRDIGLTNFMSFGISFLINRGVPINSIILILMLPVIATILSFSRQVIGIKAFGIITPALTSLSFLVMGLLPGLIIFTVVVASGTLTRLLMRRLHLLYLPRMALVLTSVSLAILLLLGIGAANNNTSLLSFSVFPTLILTLLAEEFIAVQFKAGMKAALTITGWTLLLAIGCYLIVSWELFRTIILSYPEVILLTVPINILLGRFTGLRLTEYFRFKKLLRYV